MRCSLVSGLAILSSATALSFNDFSSYVNPLEYSDVPAKLFKRQGCPGGYSNCAAQGNAGACCPTNQICTKDAADNVACCPLGAACTGEVTGGSGTSATSVLGGGVVGSTSGNTQPASTGSGSTTAFIFASPTTAPPNAASTIPNAPFPFFIIPTSFQNAAECSSYATACSSQYQACLNTLGGGANGVTVSGAGVGVTVQGASTTVAGAGGVCSSLSSQACHGLQTPICSQFGGGSATGSGFITGGGALSASPKRTFSPALPALAAWMAVCVASAWMM